MTLHDTREHIAKESLKILSSPSELFIMNELARATDNTLPVRVITSVAEDVLRNTSSRVFQSYLDELRGENIIQIQTLGNDIIVNLTDEGKRIYEKMNDIINTED